MKIVLSKLRVTNDNPVKYMLPDSDSTILNNFIGKDLRISFSGNIYCAACSARIKKSFGGGFCYPCFKTSPLASECIIFPEKCKGHLGVGRDEEWEEEHHNQLHVVYLSLTSDVKVGVTRATQIPTRWIDQGADAAIILAKVPNRHIAGVIEDFLKQILKDKTNWKSMLSTTNENFNLLKESVLKCEEVLPEELKQYLVQKPELQKIVYPFLKRELKLQQINLDKQHDFSGTLYAIKGQYLIFESGDVFNVRKHTGYEITLETKQ